MIKTYHVLLFFDGGLLLLRYVTKKVVLTIMSLIFHSFGPFYGIQKTTVSHRGTISPTSARKSSKLLGGDVAAAMARVTSFNRWAIIEHDLSTSTEVLRPPEDMHRLEEGISGYGVA